MQGTTYPKPWRSAQISVFSSVKSATQKEAVASKRNPKLQKIVPCWCGFGCLCVGVGVWWWGGVLQFLGVGESVRLLLSFVSVQQMCTCMECLGLEAQVLGLRDLCTALRAQGAAHWFFSLPATSSSFWAAPLAGYSGKPKASSCTSKLMT